MLKEFVKSNVNTDMIKNAKLKELNTKIASAVLNMQVLIEYRCSCCNKNYQKKFGENLKKRFCNKYKFSSHNISKFICKYMDDWGKFSETPEKKEDFYSHLNMEDITDSDYGHAIEFVKILK